MAKGVAWTAPAVTTLAAPRALHATNISMFFMADQGMAGAAESESTSPFGTAPGGDPPWSAPPPGSRPPPGTSGGTSGGQE